MRKIFTFLTLIFFTTNTLVWGAPADAVSLLAGNSHAQDGLTIVHIQDAHSNYEAQKSIREILKNLHEKEGFSFVALEGAWQPLAPEVYHFFPDAKSNLKVADFLAQKGEMSGAELYALELAENVPSLRGAKRRSNLVFEGVEDQKVFREDYELFKKGLASQGEVKMYCDNLFAKLDLEKSRVYSPEFLRFDRNVRDYENKRLELSTFLRMLEKSTKEKLQIELISPDHQREWPYLCRMLRVMNVMQGLDMEAVKKDASKLGINLENKTLAANPRAFFESVYADSVKKHISLDGYKALRQYSEYIILKSEITGPELFAEMDSLIEKISDIYAISSKERELLAHSRQTRLLEKLLKYEATGKEWEVARSLSFRRRPESSVFEDARKFYQLAERRNQILLENTLAKMKSRGVKKAILITGGFHSDGIESLAKQKNISYRTIQPQIHEEFSNQRYHDAVLGTWRKEIVKSKIPKPLGMVKEPYDPVEQAEIVEIVTSRGSSLGEDINSKKELRHAAILKILQEEKGPITNGGLLQKLRQIPGFGEVTPWVLYNDLVCNETLRQLAKQKIVPVSKIRRALIAGILREIQEPISIYGLQQLVAKNVEFEKVSGRVIQKDLEEDPILKRFAETKVKKGFFRERGEGTSEPAIRLEAIKQILTEAPEPITKGKLLQQLRQKPGMENFPRGAMNNDLKRFSELNELSKTKIRKTLPEDVHPETKVRRDALYEILISVEEFIALKDLCEKLSQKLSSGGHSDDFDKFDIRRDVRLDNRLRSLKNKIIWKNYDAIQQRQKALIRILKGIKKPITVAELHLRLIKRPGFERTAQRVVYLDLRTNDELKFVAQTKLIKQEILRRRGNVTTKNKSSRAEANRRREEILKIFNEIEQPITRSELIDRLNKALGIETVNKSQLAADFRQDPRLTVLVNTKLRKAESVRSKESAGTIIPADTTLALEEAKAQSQIQAKGSSLGSEPLNEKFAHAKRLHADLFNKTISLENRRKIAEEFIQLDSSIVFQDSSNARSRVLDAIVRSSTPEEASERLKQLSAVLCAEAETAIQKTEALGYKRDPDAILLGQAGYRTHLLSILMTDPVRYLEESESPNLVRAGQYFAIAGVLAVTFLAFVNLNPQIAKLIMGLLVAGVFGLFLASVVYSIFRTLVPAKEDKAFDWENIFGPNDLVIFNEFRRSFWHGDYDFSTINLIENVSLRLGLISEVANAQEKGTFVDAEEDRKFKVFLEQLRNSEVPRLASFAEKLLEDKFQDDKEEIKKPRLAEGASLGKFDPLEDFEKELKKKWEDFFYQTARLGMELSGEDHKKFLKLRKARLAFLYYALIEGRSYDKFFWDWRLLPAYFAELPVKYHTVRTVEWLNLVFPGFTPAEVHSEEAAQERTDFLQQALQEIESYYTEFLKFRFQGEDPINLIQQTVINSLADTFLWALEDRGEEETLKDIYFLRGYLIKSIGVARKSGGTIQVVKIPAPNEIRPETITLYETGEINLPWDPAIHKKSIFSFFWSLAKKLFFAVRRLLTTFSLPRRTIREHHQLFLDYLELLRDREAIGMPQLHFGTAWSGEDVNSFTLDEMIDGFKQNLDFIVKAIDQVMNTRDVSHRTYIEAPDALKQKLLAGNTNIEISNADLKKIKLYRRQISELKEAIQEEKILQQQWQATKAKSLGEKIVRQAKIFEEAEMKDWKKTVEEALSDLHEGIICVGPFILVNAIKSGFIVQSTTMLEYILPGLIARLEHRLKSVLREAFNEIRGNIIYVSPSHYILSDPNFPLSIYALSMLQQMAAHAGIFSGARVIDLGAGDGLLSRAALALGARHAVLVDKDSKSNNLAKVFLRYDGRKETSASESGYLIYEGDINGQKFDEWAEAQSIRKNASIVLANIGPWDVPYGDTNRVAMEKTSNWPAVSLILNGGYLYFGNFPHAVLPAEGIEHRKAYENMRTFLGGRGFKTSMSGVFTAGTLIASKVMEQNGANAGSLGLRFFDRSSTGKSTAQNPQLINLGLSEEKVHDLAEAVNLALDGGFLSVHKPLELLHKKFAFETDQTFDHGRAQSWSRVIRIGPLIFVFLNPFVSGPGLEKSIKEYEEVLTETLGETYTQNRGNIFFFDFPVDHTQKPEMPLSPYTRTMIFSMLTQTEKFKDAVVADFGAGDGLLSRIALGLGARKVILVEKEREYLDLAKILLNSGGWKEDIHYAVLHKDLTDADFDQSAAKYGLDQASVALMNIGPWEKLYDNANQVAYVKAMEWPRLNLLINGGFLFSQESHRHAFYLLEETLKLCGFKSERVLDHNMGVLTAVRADSLGKKISERFQAPRFSEGISKDKAWIIFNLVVFSPNFLEETNKKLKLGLGNRPVKDFYVERIPSNNKDIYKIRIVVDGGSTAEFILYAIQTEKIWNAIVNGYEKGAEFNRLNPGFRLFPKVGAVRLNHEMHWVSAEYVIPYLKLGKKKLLQSTIETYFRLLKSGWTLTDLYLDQVMFSRPGKKIQAKVIDLDYLRHLSTKEDAEEDLTDQIRKIFHIVRQDAGEEEIIEAAKIGKQFIPAPIILEGFRKFSKPLKGFRNIPSEDKIKTVLGMSLGSKAKNSVGASLGAEDQLKKFEAELKGGKMSDVRLKEMVDWAEKQNNFSGMRRIFADRLIANENDFAAKRGLMFLNARESGYREFRGLIAFAASMNGGQAPVRALAVSPDTRLFAAGNENGVVKVWDIETGQLRHQFEEQGYGIKSLQFSADSRRIQAEGLDFSSRTWIFNTGQKIVDFAPIVTSQKNIKFDPRPFSIQTSDSQRAIEVDASGNVRVWGWSNPKHLHKKVLYDKLLYEINGRDVLSLDVSSDDRFFVTGSRDGRVIVWDFQTDQPMPRAFLGGSNAAVYSVKFSPDGSWLISGSSDRSVKLWPGHERSSRGLWQRFKRGFKLNDAEVKEVQDHINFLGRRENYAERHELEAYGENWQRNIAKMAAVQARKLASEPRRDPKWKSDSIWLQDAFVEFLQVSQSFLTQKQLDTLEFIEKEMRQELGIAHLRPQTSTFWQDAQNILLVLEILRQSNPVIKLSNPEFPQTSGLSLGQKVIGASREFSGTIYPFWMYTMSELYPKKSKAVVVSGGFSVTVKIDDNFNLNAEREYLREHPRSVSVVLDRTGRIQEKGRLIVLPVKPGQEADAIRSLLSGKNFAKIAKLARKLYERPGVHLTQSAIHKRITIEASSELLNQIGLTGTVQLLEIPDVNELSALKVNPHEFSAYALVHAASLGRAEGDLNDPLLKPFRANIERDPVTGIYRIVRNSLADRIAALETSLDVSRKILAAA